MGARVEDTATIFGGFFYLKMAGKGAIPDLEEVSEWGSFSI
jgi:hypothetical protein